MNKRKAARFGPNLEQLCDQALITQSELAKAAGVTPAAVSMIINNLREPTLDTVCRILNGVDRIIKKRKKIKVCPNLERMLK